MKAKEYYVRIYESNHSSHFEIVTGYPVKNEWGLDLFAHKSDYPRWGISDNRSGMRVASGATRQEATDRAIELLSDQKLRDHALTIREVSPAYGGPETILSKKDKYAREFQDTFGIPLSKYWNYFMSLDLGFDVIKFDKFIGPPDGLSCAQAVKAKYGERAEQLIHEMLG